MVSHWASAFPKPAVPDIQRVQQPDGICNSGKWWVCRAHQVLASGGGGAWGGWAQRVPSILW